MLWLKRFDWFADAAPRSLLRLRRAAKDSVCLLRPGGVGDLVLLTRAMLELDLDLRTATWFVETRNSPWLQHLKVPHYCYNRPQDVYDVLFRKGPFSTVINTEQHHGLAAAFSSLLCAKDATHYGYSSNRRNDLFDPCIEYLSDEPELDGFKRILAAAYQDLGYSLEQAKWSPIREIAQPYIVIALAGLQSDYKTLSVSDWSKLLSYAAKQSESIVLIGSAIDTKFSEALERESTIRFENLVGKLSFERAIRKTRFAERLISVDSGFVHIADFYGVPSDVLFVRDNHKKWGPLSQDSRILTLQDLS